MKPRILWRRMLCLRNAMWYTLAALCEKKLRNGYDNLVRFESRWQIR